MPKRPAKSICILYAENRHVDNVDDLFRAMRQQPARIIVSENSTEKVGLLQAIEREDGSGRSFNVKVLVDDEYRVFYVRDAQESHFAQRRGRGIRTFE